MMTPRKYRRFARLTIAAACMTALLVSGTANAQRNLKDIPPPDPELERKTFILPEGFEVNLFASDPLIAKPIQMNFDERGRLWIASSEIYPHIKPGQKANDKVLIIEDADRDGVAEKVQVFANGLLIPTGVAPGDGGAYVVNSTELLHFRDVDGDGRADQRRVVLSGFGSEDTHHLLHTLRWGHDGALYMNQSIYIHSHVETPHGVKRLNGGGIWRFKPELLELNVVCRGFVNPWGHHFDRWGQQFATDGAYGEGINYVFPGAVYVTAPGAKRRLRGLNPGSPKHCGLEILSGRHLPEDWRGSMIANDFRAHRVCRFVVTEDGAGFASRQEVEVIKSKHVAFRPIDVKVGPDGAIYIADWYNPIIQHGEVDFRDPRRDHVHGRIWRVTAKGRPLVSQPPLTKANIAQLLKHLTAPEEWIRLHAKLQLKTRPREQVAAALTNWLTGLDRDSADYEWSRLQALMAHECLNLINRPLLEAVLKSKDHRARAGAMRVASYWKDRIDPAGYFRNGVDDEHPRVRLEAVRGLAQIPRVESAVNALRVLDRPLDRFLDFALWQAMRDLQPVWLPMVREGKNIFPQADRLAYALRAVDSPDVVQPLLRLIADPKTTPRRAESVAALAAGLGGAKELGRLFDMVTTDKRFAPASQARLLEALVRQSTERRLKPAAELNRLETLLDSDNNALRAAAIRAVGAWNVGGQQPLVALWAQAKDTPPGLRAAAIESLSRLGGAKNVNVLTKIASDGPAAARRLAAAALARLDLNAASRVSARLLEQLDDKVDPFPLLAPLLAFKEGPAALAKTLHEVKLSAEKAKRALGAVRRSGRDAPGLIAAIRKSGKLDQAGWNLTPELLAELVEEVKQKGDPTIGQAIYRREQLQCLKCHAIGGSGGRVGPDLVSVGASAQIDYLVESLIAPNKKVKENFHSVTVQTDEGKIISGIPIRQDKQQLVLRDAEDREVTIAVETIEDRKEGRSLMPDGSVDLLTRDELVHLVRFISELGKVGDFAIGKERVVRTWRLLTPTPEALHRIRRTSFDTAASDDPAFQWKPVYSLVSGDLPIAGLPVFNAPTYVTRKDSVKTVFLRATIEVTTPGAAQIQLGQPKGLMVWVDGKPTAVKGDRMVVNFARGRHSLTFAIDSIKRAETPLRVELLNVRGSPAQAQIINGR